MGKMSAKVREEIEALIPPTLFFFIALHIVALLRSLMVKGTGISFGTTASVAIGSLILGKAVLLADMLPAVNRFPDYPLAYNIAWKTLLYTLMATLIHYCERLIDFWQQAGGFVEGNRKMISEMDWPRFWAVQILLVVLILNYCTMREVIRVIGADKARRMFFGPMPSHP
ncbi:MAG: hypothetical protein ACHQ2E_09550, partial [Gemmatimonadales bacterium]